MYSGGLANAESVKLGECSEDEQTQQSPVSAEGMLMRMPRPFRTAMISALAAVTPYGDIDKAQARSPTAQQEIARMPNAVSPLQRERMKVVRAMNKLVTKHEKLMEERKKFEDREEEIMGEIDAKISELRQKGLSKEQGMELHLMYRRAEMAQIAARMKKDPLARQVAEAGNKELIPKILKQAWDYEEKHMRKDVLPEYREQQQKWNDFEEYHDDLFDVFDTEEEGILKEYDRFKEILDGIEKQLEKKEEVPVERTA